MSLTTTGGGTGGSLIPQNLTEAIKLAEIMAKGKLVPTHLQGSVSDCLLVVEHAQRWNMSPFAVAACTSVIHNRLFFEGKLIAAAVESMNALAGHFDYTFTGSGDNLTVTVTATRRGEKEPKTVDLCWKDVATKDKEGNIMRHWRVQPEQQLCYAGTRKWARRWTPAVLLGVHTPDEAPEVFAGPTLEGSAVETAPQTRDDLNASIPLRDAPVAAVYTPEDRAWAEQAEATLNNVAGAEWKETALLLIANAPSRAVLAVIMDAPIVEKMRKRASADGWAEIERARQVAWEKLAEEGGC